MDLAKKDIAFAIKTLTACFGMAIVALAESAQASADYESAFSWIDYSIDSKGWTELSTDSEGNFVVFARAFASPNTSQLKRIWVRQEEHPERGSKEFKSSIKLEEVDCSQMRSRQLQASYFRLNNRVGLITTRTEASPSWGFAPPDTIWEKQLKFACGVSVRETSVHTKRIPSEKSSKGYSIEEYGDVALDVNSAQNDARSVRYYIKTEAALATSCSSEVKTVGNIIDVQFEFPKEVSAITFQPLKGEKVTFEVDRSDLPQSRKWILSTLFKKGARLTISSRGCGSGAIPYLIEAYR